MDTASLHHFSGNDVSSGNRHCDSISTTFNSSGCPDIKFLAIRNLLDEFDSCHAEAIVDIVLKVLEKKDLPSHSWAA